MSKVLGHHGFKKKRKNKTQELSSEVGGKRSFLRGETGSCLPRKAAHVLWSREVSMVDLGMGGGGGGNIKGHLFSSPLI